MIPAIDHGHQDDEMSSRYRFVDTKQLIQAFESDGYHVTNAITLKARKRTPESVKHMVRLRSGDAPLINGVFPEIGIINSHNGTSGCNLFAGLFRLVCSNGLIIMSQQFAPTIRIRHVGSAVEQAMEGAKQLSAVGLHLADAIPRFQQRLLSHHEQMGFAEQALDIAGIDRANAPQYLTPVRYDDAGSSLWNTYNRVQERIIGGGTTIRTLTGGLRRTRSVRAIDRNYAINTRMWGLMENFLNDEC